MKITISPGKAISPQEMEEGILYTWADSHPSESPRIYTRLRDTDTTISIDSSGMRVTSFPRTDPCLIPYTGIVTLQNG